MKLLNGLELAGFIKERQAKDVRRLRQAEGIVPKLAIIRTNPDPVVDSYMKIKTNYGKDIDVVTEVHTVDQAETPELIKKFNHDTDVHGIIVQIPLPDPSQTTEILNLVSPNKDVDGLRDPSAPWPTHGDASQGGQEERASRTSGTVSERQTPADTAMRSKHAGVAGTAGQQGSAVRGSGFDAPTPMAINWLLAGYNVDLRNKNVVIVGHGRLVGKPLVKLWQASGIKPVVADKSSDDLATLTRDADILVCATGVPGLVTKDMVKPTAVIVDAGVATDKYGLVGDVAEEVRHLPDITITPTKGGVGPLTVCALFENVIRAAQNKL